MPYADRQDVLVPYVGVVQHLVRIPHKEVGMPAMRLALVDFFKQMPMDGRALTADTRNVASTDKNYPVLLSNITSKLASGHPTGFCTGVAWFMRYRNCGDQDAGAVAERQYQEQE